MRERLGCAVYVWLASQLLLYLCTYSVTMRVKSRSNFFFCSSLLKSETTWLHPGSSDLIHVDDDCFYIALFKFKFNVALRPQRP